MWYLFVYFSLCTVFTIVYCIVGFRSQKHLGSSHERGHAPVSRGVRVFPSLIASLLRINNQGHDSGVHVMR